MANPFLHLDISARGIHARILEISSSKEKVRDQIHIAYKDLPEPLTDQTPFQAGMDLVSTQMDLSPCSDAIVFISSLDVNFRDISTPFTNVKKIRQILPLELAPHLPLPEEPYVSDFFLQEAQFDEDQQLIVSASILESEIRQIVSSLKSLQINPAVITPRGLAAAVCFLENKRAGSHFLFVHIAPHEITLTLVANNKPMVVRSLGPANCSPQKILEESIWTLMGFRQRCESEAVFDIFILAPEQPGVASQIGTALEKSLPARVLFPSGSQPSVKEIDPTPLAAITPDKQPDHLFNFCKGEFGSISFFQTYKTELITFFFLALIVFSTAIFSIQKDISVLEDQIAREKQAALLVYKKTFPGKSLTSSLSQAPLMLMQASVKQALKANSPQQALDGENTPDIQTMAVLFELSNRLPDTIDIDISRLLLDNGRLVISGSTDNYNTIDKIKGLLEKSDLFKQVGISQAKAGKTKNRVLFKFIITY